MDDQKVTVDHLNNQERLHLSILHASRGICKIVEESCNPKISFDRDAVALIGEIVWKKLQEMGSDLEHFAKHAKRTTIKPADVLLLTRRNPSLTEHLSNLVKVEERRKRKTDGTLANAAQVEERRKRKTDGTVANAAQVEAAVESNTESNDAFSIVDNMEVNFDDQHIAVIELII